MLGRVLVLLRARLAAQRRDAALPVAALLIHALIAAALCGLVRGELTPFAYALVALSASAVLVAIPLLGELAPLFEADEARDFVRSQPVTAAEIHFARSLHLLLALATLALGSLIPAALLAPGSVGLLGRAAIVAGGLAQALALAAVLLALRSALGVRAHALLVAAQTCLFVGAIVGGAIGLGAVKHAREWTSPLAREALAWMPPAWFAAPLATGPLPAAWELAPWACAVGAIAVLALVRAPKETPPRRIRDWLGASLAPVRVLASRTWVARGERASFELVFDGLPAEREFQLRAYPLIAVPVAFLFLGATGEGASGRRGLLTLLLFAAGAYLPLLAAQVAGSRSHAARWLLETSPSPRASIDGGALKAVAIRFVLPLYAALAAIGCALGEARLTLALAPLAYLCAVAVLRATWRKCAGDLPLSVAPEALRVDLDWLGMLAAIAAALLAAALVAERVARSPVGLGAAFAALVAVELAADRSWRRSAR